MKWKACKKGGVYYFAGYTAAPADAEATEEYDNPQDDIIAAIAAGRPKLKTVAQLESELKGKGVL